MSNLVVSLLVIELILTAVGVLAYVYRARLQMGEENTLILADAEAHLLSGQDAIHARVKRMDTILKYVGIAWVLGGVGLLAAWLADVAGRV